MSEDIKLIKNKTNQWILNNLFWLVPLNFVLIMYGVGMGIYQRNKTLNNQLEMRSGIIQNVASDSILKKKIDGMDLKLEEARNLHKLIGK